MVETDASNFSSSSPSHRLATLSASEALSRLSSSTGRAITTGLTQLDALLRGKESLTGDEAIPGGFQRGHVTEIYGPPAVGKTALALQAAVNTLREGNAVVWIDCSHPLFGPRLEAFLSSPSVPKTNLSPANVEQCLARFHHFDVPSLAHLFALVSSEPGDFLPPDTSLVVVDDISIPFAFAYPRLNDIASEGRTKNDIKSWASARRWSVAADLACKMSKLAGFKNVAVLLLSQTVTRVKSQHGAILRPALSSKGWDDSIATRIVLFRDWMDGPIGQNHLITTKNDRFFGIVKRSGMLLTEAEQVGAFTVSKNGLQSRFSKTVVPLVEVTPLTVPADGNLKRKREVIPDSESDEADAQSDVEYGWFKDAFAPSEDMATRIDNLE